MKLAHYPIKGVIYDLDGTLAESSLNFKAMRAAVGCPPHQDLLHFIEHMSDKTEKRKAMQLILDNEWQDATSAKALPGAIELLNFLHQHHIPQAIVTRNNQQAAQLKIHNNQLPIDMVISREHFPAKPDPAALIAIAKQWQIDCQYIMYVGDFKYDLLAGNNAAMISCLVNAKPDNDYHHLAKLEFDNLVELQHAFKLE